METQATAGRDRLVAVAARGIYSAAVRPNPPRMVTVVVAVLLLVAGLALAFYQAQAIEFVRGLGALPNDLQRQIVGWMGERFVAWGLLAAAPLLLIVGSLVRGL